MPSDVLAYVRVLLEWQEMVQLGTCRHTNIEVHNSYDLHVIFYTVSIGHRRRLKISNGKAYEYEVSKFVTFENTELVRVY